MASLEPETSAHLTSDRGMKARLVTSIAVTMCLACFAWNLELPTRLGFAVLKQQYMAFELGLALTLAYLQFGATPDTHPSRAFFNSVAAIFIFLVLMYAAWDFPWLLREQSYRPWQITLIGAAVVLAVMQNVRRLAGNMLAGIVLAFLLYALVADQVPGQLIGKALTPERLVQYVGFDPSAVFGSPLAVGTVIVLLFVFFGQLLFAAGGGAFLTDLAMAMTGQARGGSAKVAVVGSALFGSISGSAVSNVVTTGVITIPLMQRGGYKKEDAGAIEAVASTGGQLTPPIMGAAAFLMAEFLEIPYAAVASAALLPAALYYISVFTQVDLIAGRDGIRQSDLTVLNPWQVMREGWHFLAPLVLMLVALFFWNMDPEDAALLSAVVVLIVGFTKGYKGQRLTWSRLIGVFEETGTSMVSLILVVAAAGFVIGVLNITGLGFALTLMLVDSVSSSTLLLLLMAAVICIVLGMGMPTSGVYVLLAALVAPSLVQAGITPMGAHLFILYFGMMSMITPPVALASFAAASIAQSDPLRTGIASMRVGWAAFVIPFVFVASPPLLLTGSWEDIAITSLTAVVGVIGITAALIGFWRVRISASVRACLLLASFGSLPFGFLPGGLVWHVSGAALTLLIFVALQRKNPNISPL